VILGRAEEVLPTMSSQTIDLVVTDPPYGVGWESGYRTESFGGLDGDGVLDRELVVEILRESFRVLRKRRHAYVFGPVDVLDRLKTGPVVELVWDKDRVGMGDLASPWGPAHERLAFTVPASHIGNEAARGVVPARLRKGTVLRYPPITGRNVRHPTEKPVPLLRELIESSSRQGEAVLDPFAGSGSTGIAAVLSGRRAILVESDPRWHALAVERVRRAEALVREQAGL
jgi:site-specific DNA-methyltransferase (adenine-specific)